MICLQTPCQVTTFRISNFRSFLYRATVHTHVKTAKIVKNGAVTRKLCDISSRKQFYYCILFVDFYSISLPSDEVETGNLCGQAEMPKLNFVKLAKLWFRYQINIPSSLTAINNWEQSFGATKIEEKLYNFPHWMASLCCWRLTEMKLYQKWNIKFLWFFDTFRELLYLSMSNMRAKQLCSTCNVFTQSDTFFCAGDTNMI